MIGKSNPDASLALNVTDYPDDLKMAISMSKFRKFDTKRAVKTTKGVI
jgi:hypothetical protein